jgi:threonine/homoserine/homoserine lactone efflux protein
MGNVIGQLLPLAVGVAISPLPIIATILMLLAPRAKGTSVGFLIGWVFGIAVAATIFVVIAATAGLDRDTESASTASAWIEIVLGVLLLLLAVKQWRGRPKADEEAALPKWMAAIDSFTFAKAAALGVVLSAVNPKNLLMCVAAGATVGGSSIATGEMVVAVAVFTVIAASSVAVPVIGYLIASDRMAKPLDALRVWLQANNAAVMSVLVLVIGVVLIGKGIGGL